MSRPGSPHHHHHGHNHSLFNYDFDGDQKVTREDDYIGLMLMHQAEEEGRQQEARRAPGSPTQG